MIACGRPSLQKLAASSTELTKSTSMLMLRSASRIITRISRREATTSTWLPASALELPDWRRGVVDLVGRQALHLLVRGLRELEHQGADAGDVLALDHQAHRPRGLLDQPPAERIEPRRRRRGDALVVGHVGGAMREPAGQPRVHRPGLEVDREVDVRVGVGERPVEGGVEQAEQQRAVDDDARRLELRLEGDAAGLRLAGAQREHALHHLLELQHLVRLAHAARGEAGELLADHADLARLLDLVAQGAQAGAVDLAGGGEDVNPLERRGQRRRDLGAHLRDELVPSLVGLGGHGVGREISHGNGAQG